MKYIKIEHDEYNYKTTEVYSIILNFSTTSTVTSDFYSLKDDKLVINTGYCWDGASGGMIDTTSNMEAALVHDVLYQMLRSNEIPQKWKEPSDNQFRQMQVDNASWWNKWWIIIRAQYSYEALQLAGFEASKAGTQKKNKMMYDV